MPRTKDGGYLIDDSPLLNDKQIAEIGKLAKAGKMNAARALFKKYVTERIAYEESVIDSPTKGGKNAG